MSGITHAHTPETLGLEEAAQYLRLGRDSTRELFECGKLPGVSLNQKHLVFRRAALDAFLAEQERIQVRDRLRRATADEPTPRARRRRPLPDLTRYEQAPPSP